MSLVIRNTATALFPTSPVYAGGGIRRKNNDLRCDGGEGDGGSSDEEEEDAQSGLKVPPLEALEALHDALPIKRGLSGFFNGKSRSFQCLSEESTSSLTATDLAKVENPFNKRRRILRSLKPSWRRKSGAFCTSLPHSSSPSPPPPSPHSETTRGTC